MEVSSCNLTGSVKPIQVKERSREKDALSWISKVSCSSIRRFWNELPSSSK